MHVVERLVRSPEALAHVLEAAEPLALDLPQGRIGKGLVPHVTADWLRIVLGF